MEINEQINELEKTKRSSLIKNIEIDNTKYGYINVADKKSTSKPKLKPFKFDLKKLEAITIGYDEPLKEDKPVKVIEGRLVQKKPEALLPKEKSKPIKFIDKVKKTMKSSLPKTVYETKDKVLENDVNNKFIEKDVHAEKGSLDSHSEAKFVNKKLQDNIIEAKPDLLKPEASAINVVGEVSKPKLVHERKTLDLVDNLNIVDIQSTLDVVVSYHLMKWVNLESYNDKAAVDNLRIPNFGKMVLVLERCRLYKKLR